MIVRSHIPTLVLLGGLLLLGGCQKEAKTLELPDLTVGERLYFERIVAVERAKSVALVHREIGAALLDSLAAAWGDSAQTDVLHGLNGNPEHSIAVGELLLRVITAEQDSLRWNPGASRLHLPLPDPNRPGRERVPDPENKPEAAVPRTD
jgi:hypothetical protein